MGLPPNDRRCWGMYRGLGMAHDMQRVRESDGRMLASSGAGSTEVGRSGAMLRVSGLRKSYGEIEALRGVDLEVAAGEIVALLGPNGAGKTTLVSIVAGLRRADAGVVEVDGLDARRRSAEVRRRIGLAPQDTGIYPVVSVRRNLLLFGELAGLGRAELRRRIDEVAEALDIGELLDRQAGKLSGGQKRRVHTAIALLHRPALLLLDEATTGAEVEALGSAVAILDHGQVIARGDVGDLIGAHAVPVVELAFDGEVPAISSHGGATVEGNRLRLPTRDPAATLVEVVPQVPPGVLSSVEIIRPNLEAVYLALTGRRYDEADREGAREEATERKGRSVVAK